MDKAIHLLSSAQSFPISLYHFKHLTVPSFKTLYTLPFLGNVLSQLCYPKSYSSESFIKYHYFSHNPLARQYLAGQEIVDLESEDSEPMRDLGIFYQI